MSGMNVLIILAHPQPGSFNHAIAEAVCAAAGRNGHRVIFHDLYAERFDPCLPSDEIPDDGQVPCAVQQHCRDLQAADGIVIVHPNCWGQPPAILKGWIDRVVRPGVAYRFQDGDSGQGVPVGLLNAKTALVFNTSNTPAAREQAVFGDPLESLWRNCILWLCGVTKIERRMFGVVVTSTPEQRCSWLNEVAVMTEQVFPPPEDLE